jgi:hypothetical protein
MADRLLDAQLAGEPTASRRAKSRKPARKVT